MQDLQRQNAMRRVVRGALIILGLSLVPAIGIVAEVGLPMESWPAVFVPAFGASLILVLIGALFVALFVWVMSRFFPGPGDCDQEGHVWRGWRKSGHSGSERRSCRRCGEKEGRRRTV